MENFLGFDLSTIDYQGWLLRARDFTLPRLGQSLLLLLAAGLVFFVSNWALRRIENRWIKKTETKLDDIFVEMLRKLVQISVTFWMAWRLALLWELPYGAQIVSAVWIVGITFPASSSGRPSGGGWST